MDAHQDRSTAALEAQDKGSPVGGPTYERHVCSCIQDVKHAHEFDQDLVNIDQADAKKLLILWTLRSHRAASAHYHQSGRYRRTNTIWTCINAIYSIFLLFWVTRLSSLVDSQESRSAEIDAANVQLTSISTNAFIAPRDLLTGFLGAFLVVLGVVQFILRFPERQGSHREAGQEFSNLQRKIERYSLHTHYNMGMIHNLSREYNHITKSYPLVDKSVWNNGSRKKLGDKITELENMLRKIVS